MSIKYKMYQLNNTKSKYHKYWYARTAYMGTIGTRQLAVRISDRCTVTGHTRCAQRTGKRDVAQLAERNANQARRIRNFQTRHQLYGFQGTQGLRCRKANKMSARPVSARNTRRSRQGAC